MSGLDRIIWFFLINIIILNVSYAQPSFTPSSMQNAVVKVTTYNKQGSVVSIGSGVRYRATRDSLYIITAQHILLPKGGVLIPDTLQVTFFDNSVLKVSYADYSVTSFEDIDLAAIKIHNVTNSVNTQHYVRLYDDIEDYPPPNSGAYALGCARSDCWHRPIGVTIKKYNDGYVDFSSPVLAPGLSGGILVDDFGRVLGVITSSRSGLGRAIPFFVIRHNYDFAKPNVHTKLTEPKYYATDFSLSLDVLPAPPKTLDNRYLLPGLDGRFHYLSFPTPKRFFGGPVVRVGLGFGTEVYNSYRSNSKVAMSTIYTAPSISINGSLFKIGRGVLIGTVGVMHLFRAEQKRVPITNNSRLQSSIGLSTNRKNYDVNVTKGRETIINLSLGYPLIESIYFRLGLRIITSWKEEIEHENADIDFFSINPLKIFIGLSYTE